MRVSVNLILVCVALWLLASIFEGCRNRPRPFQDFGKRWRERREKQIDDKRRLFPSPIDDENEPIDEDRRQWMFRDRRRLLPIRENYPCEI